MGRAGGRAALDRGVHRAQGHDRGGHLLRGQSSAGREGAVVRSTPLERGGRRVGPPPSRFVHCRALATHPGAQTGPGWFGYAPGASPRAFFPPEDGLAPGAGDGVWVGLTLVWTVVSLWLFSSRSRGRD